MSSPLRIGFGYDVHRLVEGRRCILGGVDIPFEKGLDGHSDADCLTHAISDAILGACALPDIGHFFSNTDPKWKGADSQKILRQCVAEAAKLGYSIVNIDSSIIAEAPKISPHLKVMREVLAASLGVSPDCVGIKATTNEKLGSLGEGLGIAAQAVCLLQKK